jgi:hypothetical protein
MVIVVDPANRSLLGTGKVGWIGRMRVFRDILAALVLGFGFPFHLDVGIGI